MRPRSSPSATRSSTPDPCSLRQLPISTTLDHVLDLLIGGITFSGSLVAGGKLAGIIPGRPMTFPGRPGCSTCSSLVVALASGVTYTAGYGGLPVLCALTAAALGLGILVTLPIGGADMPVVISLLNAFTGTAVAMAGFVIDSTPLIIAGALVGAAGGILTKLMADAMNRSLVSIIAGGFGTGDDDTSGQPTSVTGTVREVTVDDAALQLAYASKVVIVPGYGLAAAQAQHEVVELANGADRARRRRQLRHPPRRRTDARAHERPARRSQRSLPADEGSRGDQPASSPAPTSCSSSAPTTSPTRPPAVPATRCPACRSSTSTRPAASSSSSGRWATATPASTTSSTPTPRPPCCSVTPKWLSPRCWPDWAPTSTNYSRKLGLRQISPGRKCGLSAIAVVGPRCRQRVNPNGCLRSEAAISRSRLYFETRSPRAGAPDLIWPHPEPTARSAMNVPSVSPDRCEIIAVSRVPTYPKRLKCFRHRSNLINHDPGGRCRCRRERRTQAEYVRVPFADNSTYPVPDGVSDEQMIVLADILPTA